jgi:IS4 transposase
LLRKNPQQNGHDVRIVTYTIDEKEYYMSTNLMDNQKHSIATIKSIYNDRWNVVELFKFVKSNLSLNSIEESQEKNVLKSIYSNVSPSAQSALFPTYSLH